MPQPTGVHGLQFHRAGIRNPDLQRTDGSIYVMLDKDEGIAVRGADDVVPFRTGKVSGGRRADSRTLLLHAIVTSAAGSFESAWAEFLSIFNTEAAASSLVVTLPDGQVRRLFEVYTRTVTPGDGGYGMREAMVEIEALDPLYYGTWGNQCLDDSHHYLDRWDRGHGLWGAAYTVPWALDGSADLILTPTSDPFLVPIDTLGDAETERVHVEVEYGSGSNAYTDAPEDPLIQFGVEVVETGIGFTFSSYFDAGVAGSHWRSLLWNYERAKTPDLQTNPIYGTFALNAANRAGEFLRLPPGKSTLSISSSQSTGLLEVRLNFLPAYRGIGV